MAEKATQAQAQFLLRLDEDTDRRVRELAEDSGLSVSETFRRLIQKGLAEEGRRSREEWIDAARVVGQSDKSLLERLAQ